MNPEMTPPAPSLDPAVSQALREFDKIPSTGIFLIHDNPTHSQLMIALAKAIIALAQGDQELAMVIGKVVLHSARLADTGPREETPHETQ
jgi:hypothetical protein